MVDMSGAQVRIRRETSIPYDPGNKRVQSLPRGMVLRDLAITLNATITPATSAANNTPSNVKRGDEWSLVNRIDIFTNGTELVRSFSGNELWWLNYLMFGNTPNVLPHLADSTTNTAVTSSSTLLIPFAMPLAVKPIDTWLDTRKIGDFRIEVTWGVPSDITAAAGVTVANCSLDIYSYAAYAVPTDVRFAGTRIFRTQQTFSAAGAEQQFQPLGVGPIYRGFIFNTTNTAGTADVAIDSVISRIQLVSGPNVYRDIVPSTLREFQSLRSDTVKPPILPYALSGGNPVLWRVAGAGGEIANPGYFNLRRSSSNRADAWLFMDMAPDGFLSESLDSLALSELVFKLDITNPCNVNLIPIQTFPIRQ
jgi:hypothetical protein